MAGGRDGRDVEHVGDEIVVRIERGAAVAGRPSALEEIGGRAQMNVGVDERAAAPSGSLHDRHLAAGPHVEQALADRPLPSVGWVVPVARELAAPVAPPALQNRNIESSLRQTASGDCAPEAAADNDRVVTRSHRSPFRFSNRAPPPSQSARLSLAGAAPCPGWLSCHGVRDEASCASRLRHRGKPFGLEIGLELRVCNRPSSVRVGLGFRMEIPPQSVGGDWSWPC